MYICLSSSLIFMYTFFVYVCRLFSLSQNVWGLNRSHCFNICFSGSTGVVISYRMLFFALPLYQRCRPWSSLEKYFLPAPLCHFFFCKCVVLNKLEDLKLETRKHHTHKQTSTHLHYTQANKHTPSCTTRIHGCYF